MAYVPLNGFLFRAPLLPMSALRNRQPKLLTHPLAASALALASPDLAAALEVAARPRRAGAEVTPGPRPAREDRAGERVATALDRYRRRAAFRPTPHGLWAGVGVGSLAARTQVQTGEPVGVFRPSWKALADLARNLLDDPAVRPLVRLRRTPSLLAGAHTVVWLGTADDGHLEEKRAELDDLLRSVLEATAPWTAWPVIRAVLMADGQADFASGGDGGGDGDAHDQLDELLLAMIDDRLLHFDLVPPLVGPAPLEWMHDRLQRDGLPAASDMAASALAGLDGARTAAREGDLPRLQRALAALPGAAPSGTRIDATLVFRSASSQVTLSRAVVMRAAALAPLLFRLQEALTPPAIERTPAAALADALDATTEVFGAGALDLEAFGVGDYGVTAADDPGDEFGGGGAAAPPPPQQLVTALVDAMVAAARTRSPEVRLRSSALEELVESIALPATCELFLTPTASGGGESGEGHGAGQGDEPGAGWLLGVHAPAGATWGRFAGALGDEGRELFAALHAAEQRARPGELRLDVVFSPSDALGDICAHPPVRAAALALTSWPADDVAALTVSDLELCADPAALEALALRTRAPATVPARGRAARSRRGAASQSASAVVAPSALHRVRSTMAPQGVWRLLAGWSLHRQHAPWAVTLGPLGELAWTPRLLIDDFVVAPASWKLPPEVPKDVRAWRKGAGLPRFVQVGAEDELLPVDLDGPTAAADLAGQQRVFEIWPPLGDTPDSAGRRLEVVVALADVPEPEQRARIEDATAATRAAGAVPPPRRLTEDASAGSWQTFKLFGAADRQDALVVGLVAPLVAEARAAGELEGWFFLRYLDGPGRRPHLRLRVRPGTNKAGARMERFQRRLVRHLPAAMAAGDVVTTERTGYFPESARFGGPGVMGAVHQLFEADSELTCALLAADPAPLDQHGHAGHEGQSGGDGGDDDPSVGRLLWVIAAYDALARGLGLDAARRREVAYRRRQAELQGAALDQETAREHGRMFRLISPRLRSVLAKGPGGPAVRPLRDYEARARVASKRLSAAQREQIVAPLLHLLTVRLIGPDRQAERRAYDFWARALDSLDRHQPR
ncbi:MAG: thiopeptide-type bacteriocin biosynthesis protein [Myxococcales bacterium]